jgi:uncharacterized protein (DUF1015 family)
MMMTFVNMEAPGLVVLPTHRVVFGLEGFDISKIAAKLQENFDVEMLGPLTDATAALDRLHQAGKDTTVLLAVTSQGGFRLRSHAQQHSKNLEGLSERQRSLDVVQLHKLVLEEALGMSEDDIREQMHLKYVRDANEAIDEVRNGANAAFIINPVRMQQMRDIAFAGEVLPQKSTDFYPKMLSGLTIYSLREAAQRSASGGH